MVSAFREKSFVIVLLSLALAAAPAVSWAGHSGGAHWARKSNPFTVELGDNVSAVWDPHLQTAALDWSASSVLDTVVVAGGTSSKTCRPTAGRVEICNAAFGHTGWLAIEQLWVSGGHITQAVIKLNDTYLGSPPYNTSQFRQYILCHSTGHTLGLANQEPPLGSCMGGSEVNEHPNAHDYEQLEAIYAHVDATTTLKKMPPAMGDVEFSGRPQWGRRIQVSEDGRVALYRLDFGGGHEVLTRVTWLE